MEARDIPAVVRRRALARGDAGVAWLAALPDWVMFCAQQWSLEIGAVLEGGSEAMVLAVTLAGGTAAILKLAPPSEAWEASLRVLLAAEGRGYVRVLAHDLARGALLMPRLGLRLTQSGLSADAQARCLCETLQLAWCDPPAGTRFQSGAEKAEWLAAFISEGRLQLTAAVGEAAVERALRYAAQRRAAFDPNVAVLAHGDCHPDNALRSPDGQHWQLIDPEGLFIERAYDLGILMREWSADLLQGDAYAASVARCRMLSALTDVPAHAIWQWGFIERLSSGLMLAQLGLDAASREILAVAEQWASQPEPG